MQDVLIMGHSDLAELAKRVNDAHENGYRVTHLAACQGTMGPNRVVAMQKPEKMLSQLIEAGTPPDLNFAAEKGWRCVRISLNPGGAYMAHMERPLDYEE